MRARRRGFGAEEEAGLSMTPMIDVVFQLLIYFLITFSTAEVLANLDISRPAPDQRSEQVVSEEMIRVGVEKEAYSVNGRAVSQEQLEEMLKSLAEVSTEQAVLLRCTDRSLHGQLVAVLNECAANGFTKISVMSGE